MKTFRKRKWEWMGHILKRIGMLSTVTEAVLDGELRRGRKRHKFVDDSKREREKVLEQDQWCKGAASRKNTIR